MPNNTRRTHVVVDFAAVAAVVAAVVTAAVDVVASVADSGSSGRNLKAVATTRDVTSGARRSSWSSRAVAGVSRLLPVEVRDEYCEEWAAWMSDLRVDGTPRVRRWIELLTIVLIAAPRLAIALRLATRRAVDR